MGRGILCRPHTCYAPAPKVGGIKRWCASDVWRLSVAHIGPKMRTKRLRKTKIGTEVAHVTRDSDTTFKVKRSKVNLQGGWCGGLPHSLLFTLWHRVALRNWINFGVSMNFALLPQPNSSLYHICKQNLFYVSISEKNALLFFSKFSFVRLGSSSYNFVVFQKSCLNAS